MVYENIFLIVIAMIYLALASISDLRKREVANWLVFSLLIIGLAYRGLFALLNHNLSFFLFGVEGAVFCLIIAFGFYYGRVFAGGDTKLLIGLGPYLALASSYLNNLYLLITFIFLLMIGGSVYSIVYSLIVSFSCKDFFKKFFKRCRKSNKIFVLYLVATLLFIILSSFVYYYFDTGIFFLFPIIFFLFPFIYIYAKTIEEDCFTRKVSWKDVTIGDWLVEEVKINGKIISPYWEGLSEEDVKRIKKARKSVVIKYGIPFIPSFLIGFILLLVFRERILDYLTFLF